jgi:mono/diheme cytochrome c family protein
MRYPAMRVTFVAGALTGAVTMLTLAAHGQMSHMAPASAKPAAPPPIRTTMSELHAHGGVPPGWKFLMPPGDAVEGRKVFVAMECFACHEVKGESFPQSSTTPRGSGPELTGMGSHHPAEYFAESIANPNRVIVQGPGYTAPDGLSKMPSYADSMTLKQLVDVVAYLKSLGGGDMAEGHHGMEGSMKMGDSMKSK